MTGTYMTSRKIHFLRWLLSASCKVKSYGSACHSFTFFAENDILRSITFYFTRSRSGLASKIIFSSCHVPVFWRLKCSKTPSSINADACADFKNWSGVQLWLHVTLHRDLLVNFHNTIFAVVVVLTGIDNSMAKWLARLLLIEQLNRHLSVKIVVQNTVRFNTCCCWEKKCHMIYHSTFLGIAGILLSRIFSHWFHSNVHKWHSQSI